MVAGLMSVMTMDVSVAGVMRRATWRIFSNTYPPRFHCNRRTKSGIRSCPTDPGFNVSNPITARRRRCIGGNDGDVETDATTDGDADVDDEENGGER